MATVGLVADRTRRDPSLSIKSSNRRTTRLSCGAFDIASIATGSRRASTSSTIFTPLPTFASPTPWPPPCALANVPSMKHSYRR